MLDNTEGKSACHGVEVALARNISGDGRGRYNRMDQLSFQEILVLKYERLDMNLKVGDRN